MPLITVKLVEGVFSDAQKQELIKRVTDAVVTVEGERMRPLTWVVIEEVKSGDLGIGGKPMTTDEIKNAAGRGPKG
jgi:4-oxalocrotonate tautomerase